MKRAAALLLSAALLLGTLCACQRTDEDPGPVSSGPTAAELAELAFQHSGRTDRDGLEDLRVEPAREELAVYIENAYGIQDSWEDAAVIRATGASAFEIAVVRMEDEDAAVLAASRFMSYISSRQGDFVGYAPAEADMAANGGLLQKGPFAALFICPDPDGACDAVEAALGGTVGPGPEGTSEPSASPEPSAYTGPTFQMHDLMLRLLVEAACPEWRNIKEASWHDTRVDTSICGDIEEKYGITTSQYESGVVAYWGITVFSYPLFPYSDYELAVFKASDEDGAKALADVLKGYPASREERFQTEGLPFNAELLQNLVVAQAGRYVLLAACDHPKETALLFPRAVNSSDTSDYFYRYYQGYRPGVTEPDENWPDREKFVQPGKEDMSLYDTSAILAAWEKDDPSELSKEDKKIYDQAQKVLKKLLKDGMSDYEKEAAVYDWVVNSVNYDWTHQDVMATTPRESFTPYGGLVNRKAVCLGYATTFQLLMDLAGVECITVPGAAFSSREDHAWNMVQLDEVWYCVDVTWDANQREQVGLKGLENWDYFNVTSDHMAETNHQWDYANTPEATSEDRGRG